VAYNADAELSAAQDGRPTIVVLMFFVSDAEDSARRQHRHRVAASGAQHPSPSS
jgi:hypothetical protein